MIAIVKTLCKILSLPFIIICLIGLFTTMGLAYLFCITIIKILGSWVWSKKNKPNNLLDVFNCRGNTRFDEEIKSMLKGIKKNL